MAIRTSHTGRVFSMLRIFQLAMLLTILGLLAIYGVHLSRLSPPSMPLEFLFALISTIIITLLTAVTLTLHHLSHAPHLSSLLLTLPNTAFLLTTTILLIPREACPSYSSLLSAGYTPALTAIPSKTSIRLAFPHLPDARSHAAWLLRVRSTCLQMTAAASLAAGVAGMEMVVGVVAGVLWRRMRRVPGVEREREWRVEVGSVGGGLEEEVRKGLGRRGWRGSVFLGRRESAFLGRRTSGGWGGGEEVVGGDSEERARKVGGDDGGGDGEGVREAGDAEYDGDMRPAGRGKRPSRFERARNSDSGVGEEGREGRGERVTSGEWGDVDWKRDAGGYYGASAQRTPPGQMI